MSRQRLLLKNGNVVDGQLRTVTPADVLIDSGMIVKVCRSIATTEADTTVECSGRIVTAGFIDAHVHIESSMVLPATFGKAVLLYGTTSVVADPHEVVNVAGSAGFRSFLDEAAKAPINIFTVIPSCVPATPFDTNGAGHFTADKMKEFIERPEVVGLGEVMSFTDVVTENPEMMDKLRLFKGRPIDGHTSGMDVSLLDTYVSHGICNDHECCDEESMKQRYDRGMNIYIREGSAAHNARTLLQGIRHLQLDCSRFAFCTDDKHLSSINAEGHISHIVRMALQMGFSWGEVSAMASYNACKFYRLSNRGNVREGFVADVVVTDETCEQIYLVLKDGVPVDELQGSGGTPYSNTPDNTVKFRELSSNDFLLPSTRQNIAIGLVEGQLLTRKVTLQADEWKRYNLLATVERHGKNGNIAVCPLIGYDIKNGAVATSVSHDSHNVICAGDNTGDMAVACNRLKEIGGGYVIASNGKVTDEFALPYYGLMSPLDTQSAIKGIKRLEELAHRLGVNTNIDPFTTLSFVALPVIPTLRLLDTGLFDVTNGKFVFGELSDV